MEKIKLNFKEKTGYALGGVGKDLIAMFIGGYYMFFLTQVQGLSPLFVGLAFFVAKIWDGVNDPMMGMIVDNTSSKWGKYRPWILVGAILNAVVNIAMFFNISGMAAKYVYYSLIYVLWGMSYTVMDIPYWSMIPSLSSTESERNKISSLARVATGIGGLIVTALVPLLLENAFGQNGKYQSSSYLIISIFINILYVVLMACCVFFTKEKVIVRSDKLRFRDIFSTLAQNNQLRAYILTITMFYTSINLTTTFGVYFFAYDIKNFGLSGIFSIIAFSGYGVAMLLYPVICKKFTAKKTFNAATVMVITGYVILFIATMFLGKYLVKVPDPAIQGLNVSKEGLICFIALALCGAVAFTGFGLVTVSSTVMLADVVEYGEWKFKKRNDSLIFSMQSFMYKFAGAAGALVTGVGLAIAGLTGADPEAEAAPSLDITGVIVTRIIMFFVPIIIVIVSLIVYNKKYRLHGEYKLQMTQELIARRAVSSEE